MQVQIVFGEIDKDKNEICTLWIQRMFNITFLICFYCCWHSWQSYAS